VVLGAPNAFPTNSLLLVGGNATLELNGFDQTSAGLAWATGGNTTPPIITNGAPTVTLTLNPAANQSFPGDIIGSINLVKAGTNVQTLTGANLGYTGSTLISGGQLNLVSAGSMASSVTVAAGAALGGEASTTGSLTLNANSIVSVDPSTPGSLIAGTVSAPSSPVFVSFTAVPPTDGPVVVLSASTGISGSPANFQALGVRGGSFSFANGNKDLMYTASPTPTTLTWKGDNLANPAFWDTTTTNWINAGQPDRFFTGDNVVFNDTAISFVVAIQGASVSPAGVTVDNTANAYAISGGAIAGPGSLTKMGSGSLTVSSANSYTGDTVIKGGTLIAQSATALGTAAGGTTITNGGTLDEGGMNLGAEIVTISGAGVGGNGAIVNNSGTDQINALQQVILAGDATFGGLSRWDLRGTGNTLDMGGFTLTKTGTNLVALVGSAIYNPGNIRVAQGIFGLHLASDLGGSAANTVTVQNGATLNFYSCPSPNAWTLVMEDGSTYFSSVGGPGMNNWSGPVSLLGSVTLLANSQFDMYGDITGAGSITKTGTAVANLMANKYSGNTTVNEGRLYVQLATFATNAIVTVANGAVLEMSFPETNTVAALVLGGVSKPAGVYNSTTDPTYLAGAGSLRVVPSIPNPTDLKFTNTGSALQFSWTGNFRLQAQTNTLNVGLSSNWADYPGGSSSPVTVPIDVAKGSVFFRLVYP
jgi:fibronectin-binding autotransporter adhesin